MADSSGKPKAKVWNSLEICKLLAAIAMPVVVVAIGCFAWIAQRTIVERWERDQAEQRQLVEADIKVRDKVREVRLAIYREAAPLINDIISYHFYVGQWKDWRPEDVIHKKRQLDRLLYSHRPLLTPTFFGLYHDFMRLTFRGAWNFHGESRIRTLSRCHPDRTNAHDDQWAAHFTDEDTRQELCIAYTKLLERVGGELLMQSPTPPANVYSAGPSICPPLYDVSRC